MATLRHVQNSQSGTDTQELPLQESSFNSMLGGEIAVPTERRYVLFRLVKKKKGRTHIDGICDAVMNPKTKRRERVWLLNGVDSIWQSDLLEVLKDKDYTKRNRRSLLFESGVCRILVDDDRALEFARACTKNVGKSRGGNGKFDYYEYDPAEEQKDRLKVQMTKIDMVIKAKDMPVEKMKKLASYLGIVFYDELGQPKGDDGIRTELMIKADSNPVLFSKYIDSKEVDVAYMVKKGILEAKIDLTAQNGNAIWAAGQGFIAKIPSARKPLEYLTELAMSHTPEGKAFKEQLETTIK